jgi:predicted DNA-binding transcriptional regulator YafY
MADKFAKVEKRPDAERRLRQNNRIGRVLRLLQLIQSRGRWNAKEIAAEIDCSERTVFRDLQVLEFAGIPWMFDENTKCYKVRPGWQFPVMNLTQEELLGQVTATVVAGATGLQVGTGAKPTTRKLAATLSADRQQLLEDAEQLVTVLDLKLADHSRSHEVIRTIQWALLDRKQLTGQYVSPYHEKPIKLTLHPYRLCLAQQAWYLVARTIDGEVPKTYRVTRFKSLRALSTTAAVPEEFDLKAYFGNAWGVFRGSETHDVELLFSKEAAPLVIETTWHATQKVKQHADGTATLNFRVDGLDEILWWVLGWSGRVQVIKPVELSKMFVTQLQAALAANQ